MINLFKSFVGYPQNASSPTPATATTSTPTSESKIEEWELLDDEGEYLINLTNESDDEGSTSSNLTELAIHSPKRQPQYPAVKFRTKSNSTNSVVHPILSKLKNGELMLLKMKKLDGRKRDMVVGKAGRYNFRTSGTRIMF